METRPAREKENRRPPGASRRCRPCSRRSLRSSKRGTIMKRANRLRALICALALFAGAAYAQGIAGEDLSDAQRQVLAGQAQHWKDLDPARQEQIALGAQ